VNGNVLKLTENTSLLKEKTTPFV